MRVSILSPAPTRTIRTNRDNQDQSAPISTNLCYNQDNPLLYLPRQCLGPMSQLCITGPWLGLYRASRSNTKNLYRLPERLASLGIMSVQLRAPLNTSVRQCSVMYGCFRGSSIGRPWWRETLVSWTAVSLIGVDYSRAGFVYKQSPLSLPLQITISFLVEQLICINFHERGCIVLTYVYINQTNIGNLFRTENNHYCLRFIITVPIFFFMF